MVRVRARVRAKEQLLTHQREEPQSARDDWYAEPHGSSHPLAEPQPDIVGRVKRILAERVLVELVRVQSG